MYIFCNAQTNDWLEKNMDIELARFNMIEQQIRPWDVLDLDVLEVIEETPRENFVPEKHKNLAFSDLEIPLGHDQFMMAPKIEARMLQALQIKSNHEVLEIGTGSGFVTACLCKLSRHVDTIEYYEEFSTSAQFKLGQMKIKNVTFLQGNALKCLNDSKKYDSIAITGSMPIYIDVFEKLLAKNGRIFVVSGNAPAMKAQVITSVDGECMHHEELFETNLKPLIGIETPQTFQL